MNVRAALAGLMAVLLLSLACVSTACAIDCDLMSVSHVCSHSAAAQPAMAGMEHCGMAEHQHAQSPDGLVLRAGLCDHHICSEQPVVLMAESTFVALPLHETAVPLAGLIPALIARRTFASETPPLRSPSQIALQSILRV